MIIREPRAALKIISTGPDRFVIKAGGPSWVSEFEADGKTFAAIARDIVATLCHAEQSPRINPCNSCLYDLRGNPSHICVRSEHHEGHHYAQTGAIWT